MVSINGNVTADVGDTGAVGFNPYRKIRRRPSDYLLVAAAFAAMIALVLWAAFG
jgi:hypothetical protein